MYRIEMLPAAHGDALWVEYGDPADPVRIIIDGGPAHTYERGLHDRLEGASAGGARTRIDLFVVTHIDCDHIDGTIICLREEQALRVDIGEIWFNAYAQLGAQTEAFQPLQGEFLGALIKTSPAFETRWNTSFNHKAIVVPDASPLPTIALPQNGKLILLSPYQMQLLRLRRKWAAALRDFTPGDAQTALQRLEERRAYRPPASADVFATDTFGNDPSAPNASSIAFILEHEGYSVLFAGDAHARVLAASLRRLAEQRGVGRIKLDAFKLPHHGSMANVSPELLSLIDCDKWLISTNGAIFNHPDRSAVELITKQPHQRKPHFICNYRVETTARLDGDPRWTVWFPEMDRHTCGLVGGFVLDLAQFPPVIGSSPPGISITAGVADEPGSTIAARSDPAVPGDVSPLRKPEKRAARGSGVKTSERPSNSVRKRAGPRAAKRKPRAF